MKKILILIIIILSIVLTHIITLKTLKIDNISENAGAYEITINNGTYIYTK